MKEFLSKKGMDFEDRDVTSNRQYADELTNKYGYRSVPVTIIGDKIILGFKPDEIESNLESVKK